MRTIETNIKDGSEETTETDFKLASPPSGDRRGGVPLRAAPAATNADDEDDAAYIQRVKSDMRKSGKRRDTVKSRISPKGSIMKRRGTNKSSSSSTSSSVNAKDM